MESHSSNLSLKNEIRWHVYFIEDRNGRLYAGRTTDLTRRMKMHEVGRGSRVLRGKAPLKYMFQSGPFTNRASARIEYRMKCLRKSEKILLCDTKSLSIVGIYLTQIEARIFAENKLQQRKEKHGY